MTGDDYITLAGNLIHNKSLGGAEARLRSAVSRSYYGAFHLVVAFFGDLNVAVRRVISDTTMLTSY